MLLWENIILAVNGLLSNKVRAILTMLGIIIGIGSVIAILTVGDSITISVSEKMQSLGANDVYVVLNSKKQEQEEGNIDGILFGSNDIAKDISDEDYITVDMIHDVCNEFSDEIYAINLQHSIGTSNVSVGKKNCNINLSGVTPGYFITNELTMIEGNLFSQKDLEEGKNAIIVSDKFVEDLFDGDNKIALGKDIQVNCGNYIGNFTIIGVYKYEQNYMMGAPMSGPATDAYITLKAAHNFDHSEQLYTYFQVVTKVNVDSDELSSQIEKFFKSYYRNNRDYEIMAVTLTSMTSMVTSMMSTITVAISVIAGIALVVGGIGVMNIMLVSITERTREIGTRKALGAKNSSIRVQFIVEAMIICLIGGAIGVMIGIIAGIGLSNMLGAPASPSISSILISLIFSMSIGVFFGYYPANKAAKMNPIDALRYE